MSTLDAHDPVMHPLVMANPTITALAGTTACDRRKSLNSAGIEHCPRGYSSDPSGVDRYLISGAADVRYWDARTNGGAGRNSRTGNRNSSMYVLAYTPAAEGGCFGVEAEPEGDPNDVDPIALLTALGLI